jgi:cellulose synthase/poly-beta-1,6-N-acetylglucosamine synthase-like glycosyltransferase
MVATIAAGLLLAVASVACLARFIPTLVGLFPARSRARGAPCCSFAILIPAHNEESTLPATLRTLAELDYPTDLVRVWVVADNCTDATVGVAWRFAARCVKRDEPTRRGKGYALAFGLGWVLSDAPDVVLILDADCILNPDALRSLDATFSAGAEVVQCVVRSANPDAGPAGYVAAVGAAVDEIVAVGQSRLGLSVPLRGTGMAFRRHVLHRVPWTAFGAAEDAEYARRLREAGVRVSHCREAVVTTDAPTQIADLCRQRRRWLNAGIPSSKPLSLVLVAIAVTAGLATGFAAWPLALLTLTVLPYLRAIWAVGLSRGRIGHLARSPGVVLRLVGMSLIGLLLRNPIEWNRTRRPGEAERRVA